MHVDENKLKAQLRQRGIKKGLMPSLNVYKFKYKKGNEKGEYLRIFVSLAIFIAAILAVVSITTTLYNQSQKMADTMQKKAQARKAINASVVEVNFIPKNK